ncbi:hypothetical protein [Bradyrhizobium sp. WSM3983]|uniref:hypothetical protein n=1 Tax=Bradyrhizobium sp. WSM3983 TaxID=1038867 RepID=UPI0012EC8433|nr:hypothetical protein [Bradyrhizobium sp. WSM3983]
MLLASMAAVLLNENAFGQAPGVTGQTCQGLAQTVAVSYTSNFSNKQFKAMQYYALCEASQSADKTAFNIGYSAFSLGISMDEAQRKQFCSKSFADYDIESTDYSFSKNIFAPALNTINQCLSLAGRQWIIDMRPVSKDVVSINISNQSGGGNNLLGIDILPDANSLNCTDKPKSFPARITSTDVVAMSCSRKPTAQVVDGVTFTSAPEATLILRVAEGSFPITLAGYTSSALDQIKREIESAKEAAKSEIAALKKNMAGLATWSGNVHTGGEQCPPGMYATGYSNPVINNAGFVGRGTITCRALNVLP